MTSISEPSIGSPISNVPYDILHEIFTHCLPQYHLHYRQPDTKIAPILLCHICSSWRIFALTSPTLWVQLSYCHPVLEWYNTDSASKFFESSIEFIQWWKKNQASIAPFLNFSVRQCWGNSRRRKLTGDRMDFLLKYITSAQHLELDVFYWNQIRERIEAKFQVVFPNLHTLLVHPEWIENHPFHQVQALLPPYTLSSLQRLSINKDTLPHNFVISDHWVTLTHISLSHVRLSLNSWFSLIRGVPNIRWGYFDIKLFSIDYIAPPQCTLSQLTIAFIKVRSRLERTMGLPFSLMFTNIHLPALRTLSLSSPGARTWADYRAITALYSVLKSTPAITRLALEGNFLSMHNHNTATRLASIRDIAPVWNHATQLVHLQLDSPPFTTSMSEDRKDEKLDMFIGNIFSGSAWLDLQNPICTIQLIIISSARTTDRTRDLIMSKICANAEKAPKVVFEITSVSTECVAAEVRNEWGPII